MPNRKMRNLKPIKLISAGAILIAVAVLIAIFLQQRETTAPAAVNPQQQQSESERVSVLDAKTAFDTGAAVFVDVRSVEYYQQAHIPRALSIPLIELEERLGELDPDQWIITYCT
ncbi:MAG: hypothetical protein A2Z16_10810 [Chloroflexi bacterium RBG_16_54_18]|nr:MAG: hypothetical protein A2Z16_10810 [Chloroflexi bacterium RBG_16_54_18]